jgi:hypothetical protein
MLRYGTRLLKVPTTSMVDFRKERIDFSARAESVTKLPVFINKSITMLPAAILYPFDFGFIPNALNVFKSALEKLSFISGCNHSKDFSIFMPFPAAISAEGL